MAASPSALGGVSSPDRTHRTGYGEHPRGDKPRVVPKVGVWGHGPWDSLRLTWLQAKWAQSPEASDPWKKKWGEVGRNSQGQKNISISFVPPQWDRSVLQGQVIDVPASIQVPHPVPFLPCLPPTLPGHEGTEPKCLWLRNESLRLRPALPSNIWG